ncbi:hypothetical protein H206_05357 [Candidatus Electrothrix aarhusensis]|uniref:Uncharacterized protein n=1 Tax=Candidatus Electrothrix aarhusensis TaxID=1859131 RepID=A0A3S3RAG9_9BACT|nr:hypothetical protein H206_05357 [Candidatus Electrothrix aarhusensis]
MRPPSLYRWCHRRGCIVGRGAGCPAVPENGSWNLGPV